MNRLTPAPVTAGQATHSRVGSAAGNGTASPALGLLALTGCFIASLAGCTAGPDFARPAAPSVEGYTADPLPLRTAAALGPGGAAQRFVAGRDIPGDWWRLFHSPALDALIRDAIAANPNIKAAEAALRQAHELTLAGQGAFFPQAQASLNASRNKTSAALSPNPANNSLYYSQYTPQLGVTYMPDVFGGTRRQVEALAAEEDNQRFQLEAAHLTLTANLVAAAVTEASLRGQIAAAEESIAVQRQSLDLLRHQMELGQVAGQEVAGQEAALAQAEAALPPLRKQLGQQRHLMAVLVGRFPSEQPSATFELASLRLPEELPVSLPSRLVEQRPDIRAAEAQLHAASAQIGVAAANRLPQITLSGNAGATALSLGDLFRPGNVFWTVAANAAQTVFDGGTLRHKERAAEAAFDQAAAQYKETVLTAFQNVADVLEALKTDADALTAAIAAEHAAAASLDIARRQLSLGAVNYLALLNAENAYQQAQNNLALARAARFADSAALFQALGGGWWRATNQLGYRVYDSRS